MNRNWIAVWQIEHTDETHLKTTNRTNTELNWLNLYFNVAFVYFTIRQTTLLINEETTVNILPTLTNPQVTKVTLRYFTQYWFYHVCDQVPCKTSLTSTFAHFYSFLSAVIHFRPLFRTSSSSIQFHPFRHLVSLTFIYPNVLSTTFMYF